MSRLQQQLKKTLGIVLADPRLVNHPFFTHWQRRRPNVRLAKLHTYCATQARPIELLADIAEAVNATWPRLAGIFENVTESPLRDLCCDMSLVAYERVIRGEPAGTPSEHAGVFDVGMLAKEAAAIVAAVWSGCALRLALRPTPNGDQLHIPHLIHEHAELQFGRKTLRHVIDDELSACVQRLQYPLSDDPCEMLPEMVRLGLDRMEEKQGVRPLIALDRRHVDHQVDPGLRRYLKDRWEVDAFYYAKRRDELPQEVDERWRQLEAIMFKHFTEILKGGGHMRGPAESAPGRSRVFVSYSHVDSRHRDYVMEHFGVLAAQGIIDIWDDTQIGAGANNRAEINHQLRNCKVAVFLISPAFLSSPFILNVEVPTLLARHQASGMQLMPILVRACAWDTVSWLQDIQMRPGGAALSSDPATRDEQLAEIVREVRRNLVQQYSRAS